MKNYLYKPAALLLASFIAFFAIWQITARDEEYSYSEKRSLASFPVLTFDSLTSGDFMDDFSDYLADQFPERMSWMKLKTSVDTAMGQTLSQGVYLGKNNYLIESFNDPDTENMAQTLDSINEFALRYSDSNIYFMLVPNAVSLYSEYLPDHALVSSQDDYIDAFFAGLDSSVTALDVRDVFSQNKDSINLYYKTDHHWTSDGAYLAYENIKDIMMLGGAVSYTAGVVCNDFCGSLSSKSGYFPQKTDEIKVYMPDTSNYLYTVTYDNEMKTSFYDTQYLNSDDPYQIFLGGNHAMVTINTSIDSDRSLIIFKDSYANCFVPFLAESYRNITIVDPRYYYDDIDIQMQAEAYTDVLFLYNVNTLYEDTNLKTVLMND